jgi:glycosyltransferase involved in cell wall biosynthesis
VSVPLPGRPRLLLFEPHAGGHHAEHIRHLLNAWHERRVEGTLVAAVTPRLIAENPDLLALAHARGATRVTLAEVPDEPSLPVHGVRREMRLGWLLRQCLEAHRPQHALLMFMDLLQIPMAIGLRFPPAFRFSGILFGARFCYPPSSASERVKWTLRRHLLSAALRNRHLEAVFTLDPSAAPAIRSLGALAHVVTLPDPVDLPEAVASPEVVRDAWGVERERKMMLLFGSLAERKGVLPLLEALLALPEAEAKQLSVVLAGRVNDDVRARVEDLLPAVQQESRAQIILRDAYLPHDEVQNLIAAADLVLAPYQRHVGSSGVLVRAAAAGRPILTQDYGVVAEQVREHRLGQAVDTTDPLTIAAAVGRFLVDPGVGFDPERASAFAEANSVGAYVDILFDHLLTPRAPSAL